MKDFFCSHYVQALIILVRWKGSNALHWQQSVFYLLEGGGKLLPKHVECH